jgi:hypothetical protein
MTPGDSTRIRTLMQRNKNTRERCRDVVPTSAI